MRLHQQWHGYRRGHQLLASTIDLPTRDQDLIDKLSDSSGAPRPGERFEPYVTVYPLPSGQHHVVARTWQDLDAPRSGSVFTRSLLVPSVEWRAMRNLRPLFRALDDREITRQLADVEGPLEAWPAVDDPNLPSLVEALFLERANAVAGFGFVDSEMIAGRILQAIWPDRRSTMAVCTYALGPRSLPDRDFDLVFAPDSARPRFAKWDGRKVSAQAGGPSARHAWTQQIQEQIFRDPNPNLEGLDEIGVLQRGARTDSSSLRLALLWTDLRQKASTSPTSLLGMLDILSSLDRRPWTVSYLAPLIVRSLDGLSSLPPAEQWQFLQLLVRKLAADAPLSVVRGIFRAARRLAATQPAELLVKADEEAATLPYLLRPGVARGLADLDPVSLKHVSAGTSSRLLVSLMAESPGLSSAVTGSLSAESDSTLVTAIVGVAADDVRASRRIASGVARGARSSVVAPLVALTMANSSVGRFPYLVRTLLDSKSPPRPAIIDALVDVAASLGQSELLLELATAAPDQAEGDALVLKLAKGAGGIVRLAVMLAEQRERLLLLLTELIDLWSDRQLRDAIGEPQARELLLEAAIARLPQSSNAFMRVLTVIAPSGGASVGYLRRAVPKLSAQDRVTASMIAVGSLLSLDPTDNADLLEPLLTTVDPSKYLLAATSTELAGEQVGRNVSFIANSSSAARFVAHTALLTNRLAERRSGGYGQEGYDGWAQMLRKARQTHPEALVRSADAALDYALARPNEPAGGVAAASFPVVHARLKKNSLPEIPFNLLTAVFLLPVVLFSDWDRAKTARHGIVDIFVRSKWNPVELLRAGVDAGIPRKLLGYLLSKPGGRDYLSKIERGLAAYPQPARTTLTQALSEFLAEDDRHRVGD